jgi:hypothetical protein
MEVKVMPTFHYENGQLPEPEVFARELQEAHAQYDPIDELLSLERKLMLREQQHGQNSAEFYARFLKGEGGDSPDAVAWVGLYEAYLHLKSSISESLSLVVTAP